MSNSFRRNLVAYLFVLIFVVTLLVLAITQPMSGGLLTSRHNERTQPIGLLAPDSLSHINS